MVQLKSFAVLVSLVSVVLASTVANILTDLATISTAVTNLNTEITAFTASTQLLTATVSMPSWFSSVLLNI